MKTPGLIVLLLIALGAIGQEKQTVIKVAKTKDAFMYHIDCYLDKDTLPTSFFKSIRSFAMFNTNTDANVDFSLFGWRLTVEDAAGKKTFFYSASANPNALSLDMIVAMQGKPGMLPKSIVFDSIRIEKKENSGRTSYLDGGRAVFFRSDKAKACK